MKKVVCLLVIVSFLMLFGCTMPASTSAVNSKNSNHYTFHYVLDNGEADVIEDVSNLEEYKLLEVEKEGYLFMDWFLDEERTKRVNLSTFASTEYGKQDVVYLYAGWHIASFTVQFVCGEKVVAKRSVVYGEDAVAPNPLIKPGYKFTGWDQEFTNVSHNLIVNAMYEENLGTPYIFVVLGNWMNDDGSISSTMKKRLDLCIAAYQEFNPSYIVVSGGMANKTAGISEAQAMYNYLVNHGIDGGIIIKEDQSMSTYQNAVNSIKLLEHFEFTNLVIISTVEHFTQYDTLSYFNNAINNNEVLKTKNLKLMIYTNTK